MASLKDVRNKIVGVKKTKQITKAMNMVASAKLRGSQQRIEQFRPYADKFNSVLGDLAGKTDNSANPFLEVRAEMKTTGIILITSDRGLCGSFNQNLINEAIKIARQSESVGRKVVFYCVGKKGKEAIKRLGYPIVFEIVGKMNTLDFSMANTASLELLKDYLAGTLDEVHMVYGRFVSLARQIATKVQLLPATQQAEEITAEAETTAKYEYEPSIEALLDELLPRFVKVQVYRGMLDTSASEHAARMTAMDNATRNCNELEEQLTLLFNKTRQAAITTDLIDIVSGAGALNG